MNAIEKAKQAGKEAVLEKIRRSGLKEYGICPENLADKITRIMEEHSPFDGPLAAAGALDNEDTEHMLLLIPERMPEKVLSGLGILAYLLDASEMLLYVPEGEGELKKKLDSVISDMKLHVRTEESIADVRYLRGSFISHFETLAALSDVIEDCYRPGAYVCVKLKSADQTEYTKPVFADYGTQLRSLLPEKVSQNPAEIKAVQAGAHLYGPSLLDTELSADFISGSGVITVYTDSCCMIAASEEQLREKKEASCGKCTFCREGLGQLYTRIHEITSGKGDYAGLGIMKEIGEAMPFSSLCSLGKTGAEFTMDTLELFADEYEEHIKKRRCPANQCKAFINMYIDPSKCSGCGSCIPACPVDCIEGLPGYIHMIEDIDCTKCGKCIEICDNSAIVKTVKRVPAIPDRLTRVGRFKRY